MPMYEYECTGCGHRFEVFQRITDESIKECEKCEAPVRKILFPIGIVFKGAGFHVNDYPKSGSSGGNGKKSVEAAKDKDKESAVS